MERDLTDTEWNKPILQFKSTRRGNEDTSDCYFQFLECVLSAGIQGLKPADPGTKKALDYVFRTTEHSIDFIRFTLNHTNNFETINLESLHNEHDKFKLFGDRFRASGSLSEEHEMRSKRIDGCFRDLVSALEERRRRLQQLVFDVRMETLMEVAAPGPCELPFFISPDIFPSEAARVFMTGLRRMFVTLTTLAPSVVLQELGDLFATTNIGELHLSDPMTNTAMMAIIDSLKYVVFKIDILNCIILADDLDQNRFKSLMGGFWDLYGPECVHQGKDFCLTLELVKYHKLKLAVKNLKIVLRKLPLPPSRPVLEPAPESCPSPLWLKLRAAGSVAALTEGMEEEECPVCLRQNVIQENFSLLDKCSHVSCVQCTETWFKENSTCPVCPTRISRWTTRDHFVASLKLVPVQDLGQQMYLSWH